MKVSSYSTALLDVMKYNIRFLFIMVLCDVVFIIHVQLVIDAVFEKC